MSSVDETSIKFTWNASKACDGIQYSLNGGNWVGGDWPQTNITGLSANTQYSVKIRVKATDSQLWTESGVKYATTYAYPYCTSGPSFKIGNNVKLDFYNPLNRTIKIQMWSHNSQDFVSDQITISGNTYTGFSNVKDRLYTSIPDKTESQYTIDVWYGDIKSTKWDGGKYSINGNEYPTFNNFTYQDTNSKTIALTGNNQILVNGYSNLKVSISTANKAYSDYGSPIDKYRLNIGNMSSVEKAYSSTAAVELSINSVNSPSITVTAIDKRGYPKQQPKTATFKAYFKPIIKAVVATRSDGGVGNQVTLQFSGEWWNDNFGKVDNIIKTIEYYYKKTTDNTWTKGNIAITADIKDNDFSGSATIEGPSVNKGFDVSTAYNIKIVVTDALATSNEYQTILGTGAPALAIYDNKVSIGLKYDEDLGGALQVKGEVFKHGIVSSLTEPDTNEKIWIQKGKNLYNPSKSYIVGVNNQDIALKYEDIIVGETYTFSTGNYGWTAIGAYNSSGTLIRTVGGTSANLNQVTKTIQSDEKYIELIFNSKQTGLTNVDGIDFTGVLLERGSKATEYEPYTDQKAIYVRNDNGVYEEFLDIEKANNQKKYLTAEQIIGTWIDGKPLYRKTIQKSFVDNWTTLYLNDINADTIYINYGKTFANFKIDNTYYSNGQFYISETDFFRTFIANKNELLVAFASAMTEKEATITIEYTKTTDV